MFIVMAIWYGFFRGGSPEWLVVIVSHDCWADFNNDARREESDTPIQKASTYG